MKKVIKANDISEHDESLPFVYVPGGAKINEESSQMSPPNVVYEKKSRSNFRREDLGKVVGGQYGKECNENKE